MAKDRVERDEEDLVRLYLTDIGQYPLLTKEGEVRLAQQIEGGVAARSEMDKAGDNVAPAKRREYRRAIRPPGPQRRHPTRRHRPRGAAH